MIRHIAIGEQAVPEMSHFALLDTVSMRFLDVGGSQLWENRADFEYDADVLDVKTRNRCLGLIPDHQPWVVVVAAPPEFRAEISRAAEAADQPMEDFIQDAVAVRVRYGAAVTPAEAVSLLALLDRLFQSDEGYNLRETPEQAAAVAKLKALAESA